MKDYILYSGSGSKAVTRSEHAKIRANQGRNVNTAINDHNNAKPSDIYIQQDGRYSRLSLGQERVFANYFSDYLNKSWDKIKGN